ncbi:tudor domain-containing 6 [Pseudoliparis swirei]|uniref:tudor domain-containing 6 n=1 Tax=Pseudoliparis swirei TaxID=2059687 RepID=UPI0024BD7CBC|nr:tudor domain-containing 6 [Pseudoliparis swirei]
MCSIPGLPTPGSEVPVVITRVNLNHKPGLVELWVNMNDGRKPLYEQMRAEIQFSKKRFYGSEGKPGDLCLVCISDTWHRARMVSIQGETCNVFLIDQGQPHITISEALAWGQNDCFLLPPETESCILANVLCLENNWPEMTTTFLLSLPGKKFNGLVQHVLMPDRTILLDIPFISMHICKIGVAKKMAVDEFKSLVQKCLEAECPTQEQDVSCQLEKHSHYFYPELLTDSFELVNVTEVINPCNIFCKLQVFSKAVKILSEKIQQHYEESSDLGEAQPLTCGDPCAARGMNGRWYRSLLNEITSNGAVEVLHVDEGKKEFVPVGDIRPLHGKFLRMPVFTYICSLEGVKDNGTGWTTGQNDSLKSLLLNKKFVAKFNHHNVPQDVYDVVLYADDDACINDCFKEKEGPLSSERDTNVQNGSVASSFLRSLGKQRCTDIQNKATVNGDGLQEEKLPCTKNQATSGPDAQIKENSEHQDPMVQIKGLWTGFSSRLQSCCDYDEFTVGSSVNAKVSFIESEQKFWCQQTENCDSLRHLMQDLQNHCSVNPLVESLWVARNQDNNMWYRARIMPRHHHTEVDVRFIDYGQTQTVPLHDLHFIDPAFLRLNAQAFPCYLFDCENSTNQTSITRTDTAEFQQLVDVGASSNIGLRCTVKSVTSDEEGMPLNVVDIETPSEGACKLLTQECAQAQALLQISPTVPSNVYNCSTYNIEVGGKENVWITYSENVNRFHCQLDRNLHLFYKVMGSVKQLISQRQSTDCTLRLDSICFARFTDKQWHRGQVVEMSPQIKVHFVDYGQTLSVNESDICPFPTEAGVARSVPVQAVTLGLFEVPTEVPQEVNRWFSDSAIGEMFTISVVAKGEKGKLIVELFAGAQNLNVKVREMISKITRQETPCPGQQTDQQLSNCSEHGGPNEDCLTQELTNVSLLTMMKDLNKVHSNHGPCARDEPSSESITNTCAQEFEHEETLDEGRKPTSDLMDKEIQDGQGDSEITQQHSLPSCPEGNVNVCNYKWPKISQNGTEEVYASCIAGPHHCWCQYTNTEDLNMVSKLAQEAGQTQHDKMFPDTLGPGSPCLAQFSSDQQWYRAQIICRVDDAFHVLFIDYGNESDVDVKNVRSLPQGLLEKAPQAFLCSLSGFDESKGSWNDEVYEVFNNLLVDKPLKLTVLSVVDHSEAAVPQYAVDIECEGAIVNAAMQKYWKPVAKELTPIDPSERETFLQDIQTESNMTQANVCKVNVNTCMYRKPNFSNNKQEEVYASCIVQPHYFWCQHTKTEELSKVTELAQEAGQTQQDMMFPETLGPGSPCLAQFSSDQQWYRAQVICRVGHAFTVLFIDYGNESEADVKNVRSLTQGLLEKAPQAFLCSLSGFDESKGSWNDEVYDDFYNLLVDKPLKLTVFNMDDQSKAAVPQYAVEVECDGVIVNAAMQKHWKPVAEGCVSIEHPEEETVLQDIQPSNMTPLNVSNVNACMYKKPNFSKNKKEVVYASCIVHPHYFWCQYDNPEELSRVSELAQEEGKMQQNEMFPETLGPGSPCLALFSSDDQWYRGQVIRRIDDAFCVLFIDYGNESDVDIKNVRSLTQGLLEKAPQAFLCSLKGFDESKGSWNDEVYDDFNNLLVDKPLKLTVFNMDDQSEAAVPQYEVEIECEGAVINTLMEKYWKGLDTDHALERSALDQDECPRGNPIVTVSIVP